jgi:hypothetical protein
VTRCQCTEAGQRTASSAKCKGRKGGRGWADVPCRFALRGELCQQQNRSKHHGSHACNTAQSESTTFQQLQDIFGPRASQEAIHRVMAQHSCNLKACVDELLACQEVGSSTIPLTGVHEELISEREGRQSASNWYLLPEDCKALIVFKLSSRDAAAMALACRDMLDLVALRRSKITVLNMSVPLHHVKCYLACHPNASDVCCFRF